MIFSDGPWWSMMAQRLLSWILMGVTTRRFSWKSERGTFCCGWRPDHWGFCHTTHWPVCALSQLCCFASNRSKASFKGNHRHHRQICTPSPFWLQQLADLDGNRFSRRLLRRGHQTVSARHIVARRPRFPQGLQRNRPSDARIRALISQRWWSAKPPWTSNEEEEDVRKPGPSSTWCGVPWKRLPSWF